MMRSNWFPIVMAVGCGTAAATFPNTRFANKPAATIVDDRVNVPVPPKRTLALENNHGYTVLVQRAIIRPMELPRTLRAEGVNALDEVPDSTWFTNRTNLTPEQVRTGPVTVDSPENHKPWTILSTKYGGIEEGFIFRDARGIKYLIKFDNKPFPEVETGTDVVVDRLLWASGYNVPEDQIVYFRPSDFVLAPDAAIKDRFGGLREPLDRKKVDDQLGLAAHEPDGRIRGSTSRWIEGKLIGPPPAEGVRPDDPNDLIPHQRRRDLRGMFTIYEWLDAVDVWPGNFLDSWVADPSDPKRHYVMHYSLDFGRSLGTMGTKEWDLRRGYAYRADWEDIGLSLVTLGIVQFDWESRQHIAIPGVATLFTEHEYEPSTWQQDLPYLPWQSMDRFDGFWGAKIVARFTREQIRAAVDAARYSDPRAVEYITNTLVARQRKTVAYWYGRVAPLDSFTVSDELCFDDLAIAQGYAPAPPTRYVITPRDPLGHPIARGVQVAPAAGGHTCIQLPSLARNGYTIFDVTTTRPGFRGTTYVHVARDQDGAAHLIGIWRI